VNNFLVAAYYTEGTLYEKYAKQLVKSADVFNIPLMTVPVSSRGNWINNVNYKPTFIKECLQGYETENIVYVDVDAEFKAFPFLFNVLDCNVAVHKFDRTIYNNGVTGFEILSGTIFLRNNPETLALVERWEQECKNNPKQWDQKSLQAVIGDNYFNLPEEYCTIFDTMSHVKYPVIVHYQASRTVKHNRGRLT